MMQEDLITLYIVSESQKQKTPDEITEKLREAGWSEMYIKEAFSRIRVDESGNYLVKPLKYIKVLNVSIIAIVVISVFHINEFKIVESATVLFAMSIFVYIYYLLNNLKRSKVSGNVFHFTRTKKEPGESVNTLIRSIDSVRARKVLNGEVPHNKLRDKTRLTITLILFMVVLIILWHIVFVL